MEFHQTLQTHAYLQDIVLNNTGLCENDLGYKADNTG